MTPLTFGIITWTCAAASIVGVMLNIHRRRSCFVLWGATNATWAAVDAAHGIWAQAALQLIYFGLSVYGWRKWRATKCD